MSALRNIIVVARGLCECKRARCDVGKGEKEVKAKEGMCPHKRLQVEPPSSSGVPASYRWGDSRPVSYTKSDGRCTCRRYTVYNKSACAASASTLKGREEASAFDIVTSSRLPRSCERAYNTSSKKHTMTIELLTTAYTT